MCKYFRLTHTHTHTHSPLPRVVDLLGEECGVVKHGEVEVVWTDTHTATLSDPTHSGVVWDGGKQNWSDGLQEKRPSESNTLEIHGAAKTY